MWVSPFRYLRIDGYLLLPAAFRSLSRLSSALSAKASTLRSFRFLLGLIELLPTNSWFVNYSFGIILGCLDNQDFRFSVQFSRYSIKALIMIRAIQRPAAFFITGYRPISH